MQLTDYVFSKKLDVPKYIRTLGQQQKKLLDLTQKVCILGIILLSIFSTGMLIYGSTFFVPSAQKTGTKTITNGKNLNVPRSVLSSSPHSKNVSSQQNLQYTHLQQDIPAKKNAPTQIKKPSAQIPAYTGAVSGTGATHLTLNESLDTTHTISNVNVNNSFTSATLSNAVSINQNITGYSNTTGTYSITNIQASYNYTNVDNDTNTADQTTYQSNSNSFLIQTNYQFAQAFTITSAKINITKIRIVYTHSGNPSGDLVIYDSSGSGGSPGNQITNSPNISLLNLPKDSGDNWTTITLASPVTLTKGKYYLVLQDTTPSLNLGNNNYFTWYAHYINTFEGLYQASPSTWSQINNRLLFTYESISLGFTNQPLVYASPSAVDLTYNGNSITSTSNNIFNLGKSTATFTANDSVTFDFTYQIHYYRTNLISPTIAYNVSNNADPVWNITATTNSIPSGSYSVSNRTFSLYALPNDWNKTSVLQNTSSFSNIVYTNGSSTLLLNVTTSVSAYFWSISFISPNYMSSLTLVQNNTKVLSSPYQLNTTDTLHVLATMKSGAAGTNGSLLVYDPANQLNFNITDIPIISNQLNFSIWNISRTLSTSSNTNGTYNVNVLWVNNSYLKIGFLNVNILIITQTGLSVSTNSGNYLTGDIIHLTSNFFSYLNKTTLNTAVLTYKVSWNNTSGLLTQTGDHTIYSANITVNTNVPVGLAFITVNATLSGYVNRTTEISFTIVHNTALSYQVVENTVFYGDTVHIKMFYNDSITGNFLNQSTVTVNNSVESTTLLGQGSGQYYYNSTDTANSIPYTPVIELVISASQQYYVAKQVVITISVLPTPTSLTLMGSTKYSNTTTITKNFSLYSDDQIQQQVTFNDTRHADIVITGATVTNNASNNAIAIVSSSENLNTNIWTLTINPNKTGVYTIIFIFAKAGYQNSTYILNLNILTTPTTILPGGPINWNNNSIINIYYNNGNNKASFLMTYQDTYYLDNLPSANSSLENQNASTTFTFTALNSGGTWNYTFTFNTTGAYTFYFNFNQTGYETQILVLNIRVWAIGLFTPSQPVNTTINASTTGMTSEWGNNNTLLLTYSDPTDNILLNNSVIQWNGTTIINTTGTIVQWNGATVAKLYILEQGNGSYILTIVPYKIGNWKIIITFNTTLSGSSAYFSSQSIPITFSVLKRSTTTLTVNPGSPNNIYTVYYQRTTIIGILWRDTVLNIDANSTSQLFNATTVTGWFIYLNTTHGIYYYMLYGNSFENVTFSITFKSDFYDAQSIRIEIQCLALQTNPVTKIDAKGYITTNTSKLGYMYGTQYNWTITDNNSLLTDPSYTIYINGTMITNYNTAGLYFINSTYGDTFSVHLVMDLLPEYGFSKGTYTITLVFSKYGIKTTTYSFVLTVEGFDLEAVLNYPTTLLTGSDYTISVQVTYTNSTTPTNTSSLTVDTTNSAGTIRFIVLINSSVLAQDITIGDPVNNINCLFIVYIRYINGTNGTLQYLTTTNTKGLAFYTIPGAVTAQISQISSIGTDIPGSTYNDVLTYLNTTVGRDITITNPNVYLTYGIAIVGLVIIAVGIFLGVLFVYNKKNTTKKLRMQALKRKNEEYTQILQFISNTYNILIASASGLPIANISNALYRSSPETSSLISGLSVSIDSFLHSFQADFMTQIGETEQTTPEENQEEEKVKLSIIQREKFQIMIVGTEHFRIFVFMKEKPPKRVEEIFSAIIQELEANNTLFQGFIDERIATTQCEQFMTKYFPLALLTTFTIDIGRLRTYEIMLKNGQAAQAPLSAGAILALKRLILVRTGVIDSIQDSPEKQGKDFDTLVAAGQLPVVGIFHYDIAYTMLEQTLKVSPEEIYTALWNGADPAVKVIIPESDAPATA